MMFKKTNNDDYKELTKKLEKRTAEVARFIKKKMIELDIPNDSAFEGGRIIMNIYDQHPKIICIKKVDVFGKSIEYLAILRTEYDDNGKPFDTWKSLEHLNQRLCWKGEFDVKIIYGANNDEAISFLGLANEVDKYLTELKDKRAKENAKKEKDEMRKIKEVIEKTDSFVK